MNGLSTSAAANNTIFSPATHHWRKVAKHVSGRPNTAKLRRAKPHDLKG